MNYISSFLTAFCAACIFIGGLYMLCPEGSMSKSTKYLLSLVFLLTIISSAGLTLRKADIDIDFTAPKADTAQMEIASAKYAYSYALKKAGIDFREIEIFTDKATDGGISINKVIIYSDCEREAVINALGEAGKNIEVEVTNE